MVIGADESWSVASSCSFRTTPDSVDKTVEYPLRIIGVVLGRHKRPTPNGLPLYARIAAYPGYGNCRSWLSMSRVRPIRTASTARLPGVEKVAGSTTSA